MEIPKLKAIMLAVVCGLVAALVTGFFENMPGVSIIGAKYYGFPLYWRVTMVLISPIDTFVLTSLAINIVFWIVISLVVILLLERLFQKASSSPNVS